MSSINIRPGTPEDVPQVHDMICELADYERALEEVKTTPEQLTLDGFGNHPAYYLIVADAGEELAGMMLYFYRYSTWKGKIIFLEDFYVRPTYRRQGLGEQLFQALAQKAEAENAPRIFWQVLDWNEAAIGFYKKLGATIDPAWHNGILEREDYQKLLHTPS